MQGKVIQMQDKRGREMDYEKCYTCVREVWDSGKSDALLSEGECLTLQLANYVFYCGRSDGLGSSQIPNMFL